MLSVEVLICISLMTNGIEHPFIWCFSHSGSRLPIVLDGVLEGQKVLILVEYNLVFFCYHLGVKSRKLLTNPTAVLLSFLGLPLYWADCPFE